MFKNKTIKLFLMLNVILFSFLGVVGCSNSTGSDKVNATYIEMSYPEDTIGNELTLVNNHSDLLALLKNDAPEKYNDSFFETKSLLIFKITEPICGNKSEIESYEIINKTLNVYIKTKQYGIAEDARHWVFILELSKDEIEIFECIKIFKDGNEIMNGTTNEIKSFYTLQEAYNESLLNIEALEKVAAYHNNGQQAKDKLAVEIINKIKEIAAYNWRNDELTPVINAKAEEFMITKYYGTYNDIIVFMINNPYFQSPAEDLGIIETVAGIDFYYSSTDRILAFENIYSN